MKTIIIIMADTNDGDYVTKVSEITEEQLNQIKPVIEKIKNFKPYTVDNVVYDKKSSWTHNNNFPIDDAVRTGLGQKSAEDFYCDGETKKFKDAFDLFMDFIPYNEYGFHTISEIKIIEALSEEQLL